jgi:hypothetical protein
MTVNAAFINYMDYRYYSSTIETTGIMLRAVKKTSKIFLTITAAQQATIVLYCWFILFCLYIHTHLVRILRTFSIVDAIDLKRKFPLVSHVGAPTFPWHINLGQPGQKRASVSPYSWHGWKVQLLNSPIQVQLFVMQGLYCFCDITAWKQRAWKQKLQCCVQ